MVWRHSFHGFIPQMQQIGSSRMTFYLTTHPITFMVGYGAIVQSYDLLLLFVGVLVQSLLFSRASGHVLKQTTTPRDCSRSRLSPAVHRRDRLLSHSPTIPTGSVPDMPLCLQNREVRMTYCDTITRGQRSHRMTIYRRETLARDILANPVHRFSACCAVRHDAP